MIKYLNRFIPNRDGASAVELSLLAPVLIGFLGLIIDYGLILSQRSDMSGAVTSGTRYFMLGGTDRSEATFIVETAWDGRPDDAEVSITEVCYCDDVETSCSAVCEDTSLPESHLFIRASASVRGVYNERTLSFEDVVRVR